MTEKSDPTTTESIELDLEDTISDWSQVIEDAMAVVDSTESQKAESEDNASQDRAELTAEEAAAGEDAGEEKRPSELEIELMMRNDRLEAEGSGLRDRLARTLADFENFRKRSEREKDLIERFALTSVLKDFLGVFDNLGRALAASGNAEDLKQGVDMIARQFYDLMRRYGVEPIEATGQPFDPKVHEAVASTEGADVELPTVTDEHQRGYVLHDRLLRPAMVTVAMPAPKPAAEETQEDPGDEIESPALADADPEAEDSDQEVEDRAPESPEGAQEASEAGQEEAGETRETIEEPAG